MLTPAAVSAVEAVSAGDNLTDAWRTVAPHLARRPGRSVLILSAGSIGLYAADTARASEHPSGALANPIAAPAERMKGPAT